jgi:RND family efflux transporter MFP subunit
LAITGQSRKTAVGLAVVGTVTVGLSLPCGLAGCGQPTGKAAAATKPASPADVKGAPKEAELNAVTLKPEAEKRLGVATAKVERKSVPRTAIYAGEVTIPPGRLISVTSPFAATVLGPGEGAAPPVPGAVVKEGQTVFVLVPILAPEVVTTLMTQRANAAGQIEQFTEQLNIAKVNRDRAEDLLKKQLVGPAALVDAKAQYDLASANLKTAQSNLQALDQALNAAQAGSITRVTVTSPASGTVQNVHVSPGQKVGPNAALFEVAGLDPVWVKVPVFVGDMKQLAADKDATIGGLADAPGAPGERPGKPVVAPPAGDPLAATVHVFYSVANNDGLFHPGERVGVTLPLRGESESLTVPRNSLLRDIYGGAWVYEKVGDHVYRRQRVLVDRVVGDLAVLVNGPKVGAAVVTDGAAELFGTEFGSK